LAKLFGCANQFGLLRLSWTPFLVACVFLTLVVGTGCADKQEEQEGVVTTLGACGDITYYGKCDDDGALLWCDEDKLYREDCEADGRICGPSGGDVGYLCREPCGEITKAGICDGNTVVWCHAGGLLQVPCDEQGGTGIDTVCAWNSEDCVANCYGCGTLTEKGSCDGDLVRYCDNGIPRSIDCAVQEKDCGVDTQSGSAACVPVTPPESCEPGVSSASCTEEGLYSHCLDDGTMSYYDCEKDGLKCAVNEELGWVGCSGCDDVSWWDEPCMWGWRSVCKSNFVFLETCEEVCDAPL
jgi:hypothetical protein